MPNLQGSYVNNPPAYCALHKCCLSTKNMKKRQCIQKKCYHLRKLDHPLWTQRESAKQKRKARKEKLKKCGI